MNKFGIFFVATFLFLNVQSDFLSEWRNNFEDYMENFSEELSRKLENQGIAIQQQAEMYAEQAQREQKMRQEELKKEQDKVMEIVKQIQAGNIPDGINSANTTTLSENMNGKKLTVKTTLYSIGNQQNSAIYTVQEVSEGETVIDWSINSIIWNGIQLKKQLVQYRPQSSLNINGGQLIISGGTISGGTISGGTTITNQGDVIILEINL